jgi:hypothetical protein
MGNVEAKIEIEPEALGPKGVTFEIYPSCCEPCRKAEPKKPCSDCCVGVSAPRTITFMRDQNATLNKRGLLAYELDFADVSPGKYWIKNDAGLLILVEVKGKDKTDLGKILIETGKDDKRPRNAPGTDRPPEQ